jgi:hypothetical protein
MAPRSKIPTATLRLTGHHCYLRLSVGCRSTSDIVDDNYNIWAWSKFIVSVEISLISHAVHELLLLPVYRPPLLFAGISRHRTLLGLVPLSRPWPIMWDIRWDFAAISLRSWDITTSCLLAAIAISGCRSDIGRHRTMLVIAPACWAWSKMSRIRWNISDIWWHSWVITTSGI